MYDNDLLQKIEVPNDRLSNKQTKKYFQKYHCGDREAREKLILYNVKLVMYRINGKFNNFPFSKDELFSVGIIGLIKSVDTFNVEKGYNFSTYAIRCIDNEILMFTRKENKHLDLDSLDRTIAYGKDDTKLKVEDVILDDTINLEKDYEKKEQIQFLHTLLEELSEEELNLLSLYFENRLTQEKIANQQHTSRSSVSKKIKMIVKKLAEGFKQEDEQINESGEANTKNVTINNTKGNKYLSKKIEMKSKE